ncbi:MAG: molybdopterin-binding protein [Atribacterota bacterium]|jgi:molybdenum cofactor synthesis domain-containing protein|nr:molybdopterin-binding protein [Atribacterota bacterium]MDD4896571.1 molybdopterin-binding protein [Atribacterota bacterium]MDD5636675.1 molybdopterin-binding protein [Atribacterota bacterium]
MKKVPIEKAIGMKLCHDITQIVPGKFKGPLFCKGHIIREEDIGELRKIGKEHLYIWHPKPGEIHENEAALRISKAVSGENITFQEPVEGKITLKSQTKGLFKVRSKLLYQINSIKNITIASLPNNFAVEKSQGLAGVRIVPLSISEKSIKKVELLGQQEGAVFLVQQYKPLRVGIITTGNEVYKGLIEDGFGPLLRKKFSHFGADVQQQIFCEDKKEEIIGAIRFFTKKDIDLIALSGGMSVDPDDLTPGAIKDSGARIVTYGVPVQPGNMFLLAYLGKIILIGIPGASLFYANTILDIVLPRIFAGEILSKKDFVKMGEGGFCSTCTTCHYPFCYFGK